MLRKNLLLDHDLAALKYWGPSTSTNFPVSDYERDIEIMQNLTKEEYLATLRRQGNNNFLPKLDLPRLNSPNNQSLLSFFFVQEEQWLFKRCIQV